MKCAICGGNWFYQTDGYVYHDTTNCIFAYMREQPELPLAVNEAIEKARRIEREKAEEQPCIWERDNDEEERSYQTDCGEMFHFTEGGPIENKINFCCYCGKRLGVAKTEDL